MVDRVADDECAFHVNRSWRAALFLRLDSTDSFESVRQSLMRRAGRFCREVGVAELVHRVIATRRFGLWDSRCRDAASLVVTGGADSRPQSVPPAG